MPLTIQGGEPTIHREFYQIINGLEQPHKLDLLTNLQFDPYKFIEKITPETFYRDVPYAAIRISYHPETMDVNNLLEKALILKNHNYQIGIYSVLHPQFIAEINEAKNLFSQYNIDFRTKDFLGEFGGKIYGNYKYQDAVFSTNLKSCQCKTSELLIDPFGLIYRCHHDLYNNINPIGHILDDDFQIKDLYTPFAYYGKCNPCDVKIKNNRNQEFGHTSVDIIMDEIIESVAVN